MSSALDLYESRMSLFYHGDPKEFLLFVRNFIMTLATTGTLGMDAKAQYLCRLVLGESLHHCYLLSIDV